MATTSALDKIMIEKLRLMSSHRFFASILLHLKFVEVEETKAPTMGVDAFGNCFFNAKFVNEISKDDLKFVLCHELLHVILRHCYRFPDNVIPDIWNIAVDAIVNDILKNKEKFNISEDLASKAIIPNESGIYRFKFINKDQKEDYADIIIRDKPAESIYYEILKLLPKQSKSSNQNNNNGEGYRSIGGNKALDKHILGNNKPEDDPASGSSNSQLSEEQINDLDRKWSSVAAAANMEDPNNSRGGGSGWLGRLLKDFAKPQLNWRALLRKHIKETIPYDSSYKMPRRRTYSTGVYYPITYYKPHMLTVAVDISGSISEKELETFITEIYGITRAYNNINIRVLFWSTLVDDKTDIVYKPNKIKSILGLKAYTTGGTLISCVEDYIEKNDLKESSIIYLTDGFVESSPNFKCRKKKRIFIIQKDGSTDVLEKYGPTARLKS